jgi:glycosyltransferase involved in cell wall biosynthesis
MRVLLWTEAFWPSIGGLERFVTALVVALRERGHDILVVTDHHRPGLPDTEYCRGIPVHRFPFLAALRAGETGDLERLGAVRPAIAALKRTFAPDLIHWQLSPTSLSGFFHLETATAWPAPWAATLHGSLASLGRARTRSCAGVSRAPAG